MPVSLTLQPLQRHYDELGRLDRFREIDQRLQSDRLAVDYEVVTWVEGDLAGLPYAQRDVREFRRLVESRQRELHLREVQRLHGEFQVRGGRFLLPQEATPEAVVRALAAGERLVEGGNLVFESPYWGSVDLSQLNRGLPPFHGGRGLVALFYGLSILKGDPFIDIQQAPRILRRLGGDPRQLEWKASPVNWRHTATIIQEPISECAGPEGRERFAKRWVGGNLGMTYPLVSFLYSRREVRALQWGTNPRVRLSAVAGLRTHLDRLLQEAERLPPGERNLKGYLEFAQLPEIRGSLATAFQVASGLLTPQEFARLRWESQINLHVSELGPIQTALDVAVAEAEALPEARGNQEGYVAFAERHLRGNLQKTYMVASAILGPRFKRLRWGKQIPLYVAQLPEFRVHLQAALRDATAVPTGETNLRGYIAFATHPGCDGDMQKAYQIASALLTPDEFEQLRWGKRLHLKSYQIDGFRRHLQGAVQAGARLPEGVRRLSAYAEFANLPGIDGDMQKAHQVACALLSPDEVKQLRWGPPIPLHTDLLDPMRERLERGVEDLSLVGVENWRRLSAELGRPMEVVQTIARTLLPTLAYQQLGWDRRPPPRPKAARPVRPPRERTVVRVKRKETTPREPVGVRRMRLYRQHLEAALVQLVRSPSRGRNLDGYIAFAQLKGIYGDLPRAHTIASQIMGPRFRLLRWGRQIPLNVRDLDSVRSHLTTAVEAAARLPATATNLEGYIAFADLPVFGGDMRRAQRAAATLLTPHELWQLKWGRPLPLQANQLAGFREHLRQALARADRLPEGRNNLLGYVRFAQLPGLDGDLQMAHRIASRLLTPEEFRRLRWGRQIPLTVPQLRSVRPHLMAALRLGRAMPVGTRNLDGYVAFASLPEFQGSMKKAFEVASLLLPREDFRSLRWGRKIPLRTSQVVEMRSHLRRYLIEARVDRPARRGRGRAVIGLQAAPEAETHSTYFKFAKLPGLNGDLNKAHRVAQALLPPGEFSKLGWGRRIHLHVSEVPEVRAALHRALGDARLLPEGFDNREGYVNFANRPPFNGNMDRAYRVATVLLTPKELQDLKWGPMSYKPTYRVEGGKGTKLRAVTPLSLPFVLAEGVLESEWGRRARETTREILFSQNEVWRGRASHAALLTWVVGEGVYRGSGSTVGSDVWKGIAFSLIQSIVGLLAFIGLDRFYALAFFGTIRSSWFSQQTLLNAAFTGLELRQGRSLWPCLISAGLAAGTLAVLIDHLRGGEERGSWFESVSPYGPIDRIEDVFWSQFLSGGAAFVLGNISGSLLTRYLLTHSFPRLALGVGGSFLAGIGGMALGQSASRLVSSELAHYRQI